MKFLILVLLILSFESFAAPTGQEDCDLNDVSMNPSNQDIYCKDKLVSVWCEASNYWVPAGECGKTGTTVKKPSYANCKWSEDIPRMIVTSPNYCSGRAGQSDTRTCTGFIVCESQDKNGNAVTSTRRATCSEKNCADDKASACSKEGGYSSVAADGAEENISSPVKSSIRAGARQE